MHAPYLRNDLLQNEMLPADIVLGPAWWYHHQGITFDEDYFFHPLRRVEVERQMERTLHERWGRFGLGQDRDKDLPLIGAVHLAAGFLVSEMLGCSVVFREDAAPHVLPGDFDPLKVDPHEALESPAHKKLRSLIEALKTKYGYVLGDVNFSGVLNVALDFRGQTLFMDMIDKPHAPGEFFAGVARVIERFTREILQETGSTSISVNRNVRHVRRPIFLHSECAHVMISVQDYEKFLMPYDAAWSERFRPFGIHYCGVDPHRYAEAFARLPHLDFLDVGWPGDVAKLRAHLPNTFLNIRYSPVDVLKQSVDEIRSTVRRLVRASGNPWLTGVCCINMDEKVTDEQVTAIFEEVELLREEYAAN